MAEVVIVQRKSAIGEKAAAKRTLETLGLGRPGQHASHEDSVTLRGKLRLVAHLVEIEEKTS